MTARPNTSADIKEIAGSGPSACEVAVSETGFLDPVLVLCFAADVGDGPCCVLVLTALKETAAAFRSPDGMGRGGAEALSVNLPTPHGILWPGHTRYRHTNQT